MNVNHKRFSTTVLGLNLVIPGIAGMRIVVYEIQLYNTALQDVWFQHGQTIEEPKFTTFPAGAGFTRQYDEEPVIVCEPGAALYLNVSVGGIARGYLKWRYIPESEWKGQIS